ncbi:MAG: hypothetical protein GXX96_30480 [Planctomycetaceae bacterium]|nr:hypothetical protein [Planctomycetaceae bacterium]
MIQGNPQSTFGASRRLSGVAFVVLTALGLLLGPNQSIAASAELWIGVATADITPEAPVAQEGVNIALTIKDRCTANVLALESRQGDRVIDQAVLVSCDLCILPGVQEGFRKHLAARRPGFDINKLSLAATHTHTSMMVAKSPYNDKDYGDAVQPETYLPFLYERMGDAVTRAWETRAVGAVAWGLGHAVLGRNRRVVYSDGTAKMHGKTNDPKFSHIEGYEDHTVDILCFYDAQQQLKATAIAMACTAQAASGPVISADFWHEVRKSLHQRYGQDLCVLGFVAPAGDQTPRVQFHQSAESRMERLRGLDHTQEMARRIVAAFDDVTPLIAKDIRSDVPLVHLVRQVDLPARIVTPAEYAEAKKTCDEMDAKEVRGHREWYWRGYQGLIVQRYLAQQKGEWKTFPIEMHVLRLGDVAIATNPFELFLDYGVQIQARSPAPQTVLIELASPAGYAGYVPTPRAVEAGGYSAEVLVNMIGPEGAQVLVDRTVEAIRELFP